MASRNSAPTGGRVLQQTISLSPDATTPGADQPQGESVAPSFWERLYAISPEDWATKYFCYLYRGRSGSGPSLEKITHVFDPEWVKQKYGGGEYRAMLNDERYKMVASHSFSIDGPPRPTQGEAQTSAVAPPADSFHTSVLEIIREGQRETRALVREMMDMQRDRTTPPAAAAGVDPNIAVKGVIEMFTAMMPKQQDPLALLGQLKDLIKPAEQTNILTMLKEAKELGLIPGAGSGGNTDLLGQVDALLAVAEKLGGGARGGSPSIMSILAEKAPEIVGKVGAIVENWGKIAEANRISEEYKFQRARVQTVPGAPVTTLPAGDPRAVTQIPHAPQAGGLELEPIPGATQTYSVPPAAPLPVAPIDELEKMKHKIVLAIANGFEGADIVSIIENFDERLVDTFVGVTQEQLEQFFATDAILQPAVNLPRFKDCMREIVEELAAAAAPDQTVN